MPKPAGLFILVVALLLPVAASAGTTHESFDVTGSVFPCPDHTYTVTSGTIKEVVHESVDANGITHFTVTDTPSNVRLVDEAGVVYSLRGATNDVEHVRGRQDLVSTTEIVRSRARLCRKYGTSGRALPLIAPPV